MQRIRSEAAVPSTVLSRLIRLGRFFLFLVTAGWLFPHACTEGMDLTQIQHDRLSGPM